MKGGSRNNKINKSIRENKEETMKRILCLVLILSMIISLSVSSFASSNTVISKNEVYLPVPKSEQITQEKHQQQSIIREVESQENRFMAYSDVSVRTPLYEYKHVFIDSEEHIKVPIGYAGNQPGKGTVFTSQGGFYWQDGGNEIDVSLSVGHKYFYIGVSKGNVETTGTWISSPYINQYCKLFIYKDIKVKAYKLYRKPLMMPNASWEFLRDYCTSTETADYLHVDSAPYNL